MIRTLVSSERRYDAMVSDLTLVYLTPTAVFRRGICARRRALQVTNNRLSQDCFGLT